ncbi:MAG: glycosyltransferase [Thiohalomonadales bacterium]
MHTVKNFSWHFQEKIASLCGIIENFMFRRFKNKIKRIFRRLRIPAQRKIVNLMPDGEVRGNVLLAYIIDPFLGKDGAAIDNKHTHYWESFQIAQTFLNHHYSVDVISYLNRTFTPKKNYDYFISARTNLERIANRLNDDCIKVAHLDTAHWVYNNKAAYDRLSSLLERRGVVLNGGKNVEENWAVEAADVATILGNKFTRETYAYSKIPVYHIPISAPCTYPWDTEKNFDNCRRNYLWFGSSGFVHKGLDIVLDTFAQMPDYNLVVCGPLGQEKRFVDTYRKELYDTPNINTIGWVDVESSEFIEIARNCIGLAYPTCSEGGGGSAITCMHAGIIPILSNEASVDLNDNCGILLKESSDQELKKAIITLSDLPTNKLEELAYNSWSFANNNHTRERFADEYDKFVSEILPK